MAISRNIFWIAFFASILAAWWWLYSMSLSMNMDLLGRMSMENAMAQMSTDPDIASVNNMSLDENMTSGQSMSENTKMVAVSAMTGSMLMNTPMTSFYVVLTRHLRGYRVMNTT